MELAIVTVLFLMGFGFMGLGVHIKDRFFLIIALVVFLILSGIFFAEGLA